MAEGYSELATRALSYLAQVAGGRAVDSFAAAREKRLKVSGKPDQYDDLSLFVREQEVLDRLVAQSSLPVLKLDVSDNDLAAAADQDDLAGSQFLLHC